MIIGFTLTYFLLVVFNESWLASTVVYSGCLVYYMQKTGQDLLGSENQELVMRCVFCIMIYAIVGYRIEILTKQSFMGRESSEKAFHRWMKIFETFPEGIALVRNNYILYANRALKYILNVGLDRTADDDPLYDLLKGDLKTSVVQQWVKNKADLKKQGLDAPKHFSVWNFLMNNEKGAIFQLMPRGQVSGKGAMALLDANKDGDIDEQELMDEFLNEIPKYVTLNQVNVRIAGGTDKLLVVRDVTSIVMNEKIMETKREMSKLTDHLMRQLEENTNITEQKLQRLDQHVQGPGQQIADEGVAQIQQMQYRIKDFQQVYYISENKFKPVNEKVNVKNAINKIVEMTQPDVKNRNIELQLEVADNVPAQISSDYHKVTQVLMNMFM